MVGEPVYGEFPERPKYANMMNCALTPFDLKLTFALIDPPLSATVDDTGSMVLRPKVVTEIMLPIGAIPAIIGVLQQQLDTHAAQFQAGTAENQGGS